MICFEVLKLQIWLVRIYCKLKQTNWAMPNKKVSSIGLLNYDNLTLVSMVFREQ